MNIIKRFIKTIIPQKFFRYFKALRAEYTKKRIIWKGVYQNFEDLKLKNDDLKSMLWAEKIKEQAAILKKEFVTHQSHHIQPFVTEDRSFLPFLCSIIGKKSHPVRILDVGGGPAIELCLLKGALGTIKPFHLTVLENVTTAKAGMELFNEYNNCNFITELKNIKKNEFDIVHMNSVLQYIDDPFLFLKELCLLKSKYFLFIRLSALENKSYVSYQVNMPGLIFPYRFISIDELIQNMKSFGYDCIFKGVLKDIYNQDNFPENLRMNFTSNLLFELNEEFSDKK